MSSLRSDSKPQPYSRQTVAKTSRLRGATVTESVCPYYGDAPTETYTALHSFYLLVDRPEIYGLPDSPFNPWIHMPGDYFRTALAGVVTLLVPLAAFLLWGG
jgi:hypothetical protein